MVNPGKPKHEEPRAEPGLPAGLLAQQAGPCPRQPQAAKTFTKELPVPFATGRTHSLHISQGTGIARSLPMKSLLCLSESFRSAESGVMSTVNEELRPGRDEQGLPCWSLEEEESDLFGDDNGELWH